MKSTTCIGLLAAGAIASPLERGQLLSRESNNTVNYFSDLTPSPELSWSPCFQDTGNYSCALLEVPLDYEDESAGTTHLGIIKWHSNKPNAEDVVVNSGGPGGSDVQLLLLSQADVSSKVGEEYNLVGIDPRGVNNSGPSMDCFPDSPVKPFLQNKLNFDAFTPVDGQSEYESARGFQTAQMFAEQCSDTLGVNGSARYANTPAITQDYLHYIKLDAEARGRNPKEAKLRFIGFSYGTVLGATFAQLYPDRVERMILDGVLDLEDYYSGGWLKLLQDADAAVRSFFTDCFEAGPELCVFHKNATSAEEIEERYLSIYGRLKESPVAVVGSPFASPVKLEWQDLSSFMFLKAYGPIAGWLEAAQGLSDFEDGNYTTLAWSYDVESGDFENAEYDLRTVRSQTTCIDLDGRYNVSSLEKYQEHVATQNNISFYGGPMMSVAIAVNCGNYSLSPPESQKFDGKVTIEKTNKPILFASTLLDPITPLPNAKKMASLFPEASVLHTDSVGHTTLSTPDSCVNKYMRDYFRTGELPPPDTSCEEKAKPFQLGTAEKAVVKRMSVI